MSFFKSLFGSIFHDPSSEFDVPGVQYGGHPISAWFRALADPVAEAREGAEVALAAIGEPALPALVAACYGQDFGARIAAASALGRIGEPAFDVLIDLMHDVNTRMCVPIALNRMGAESLSRLGPLFEKGDAETREGIAFTIAELAHTAPVLLKRPKVPLLISNDPLVGMGGGAGPQQAAEQVAKPEEPETPEPEAEPEWDFSSFVDPLYGALTSPQASLRREAARALWRVGRRSEKIEAEALVTALSDDDLETRLFAAGCLAEFDTHADQALEVVIAALGDESVENVRLALHIVPSFRPESARDAIDPLFDSLLHSDRAVQYHTKIALSHFGKVAVPAIVEASKSKSADLRRRLASVLGDMREQYAAFAEAPDDSAPPSPELSARMAGIKAELPRIIRCLISLANDEDPTVTERALRSLGFASLDRIPAEVRKEYASALEKHDRIAFQDLISAALQGTPEQRRDIGVPLFQRLQEGERGELLYDLLRQMVRTPELQEKGIEALRDVGIDRGTLDEIAGDIRLWVTEEGGDLEKNWRALEERLGKEFPPNK